MCCDVNRECQQHAHDWSIHCRLIFGELSARLDDYLGLWLWMNQECRSTWCDSIACVGLLHRLWLWHWLIGRQLESLPTLISAIVAAKDSEILNRLINNLRLNLNAMVMSMDLAANTHHAPLI